MKENEANRDLPDPMNQALGFSKSLHFIAGYNWLMTKNLRLKIETYYQHLYNIPVKENDPAYSILNFGDSYFNHLPVIDSLVNKGTGKNYGIEFTIERFLDKGYYALLTSSFYESKYNGYDGIERNTAFNGNFILNGLAGKEFKSGKRSYLSLNLKVTFAGSLRVVPYEILMVSQNHYRQVFDWNRAYENRRNDYFRLNGRIGYKLIRPKFSAELSVDLMNMTNHRDIFTERFNAGTGSVEYSYQFPFLPIGFLRFQF